MSIILFAVFVLLVYYTGRLVHFIKNRKGQRIPLEHDRDCLPGRCFCRGVIDLVGAGDYLDVTEEQRTGEDPV